jgi:hypothetical protein
MCTFQAQKTIQLLSLEQRTFSLTQRHIFFNVTAATMSWPHPRKMWMEIKISSQSSKVTELNSIPSHAHRIRKLQHSSWTTDLWGCSARARWILDHPFKYNTIHLPMKRYTTEKKWISCSEYLGSRILDAMETTLLHVHKLSLIKCCHIYKGNKLCYLCHTTSLLWFTMRHKPMPCSNASLVLLTQLAASQIIHVTTSDAGKMLAYI